MLQMSKLIRSRDEWRAKATKRAEQVREFKKANLRYQNRISELKEKLIELEESNKKKTENIPAINNHHAAVSLSQVEETRALCVFLIIKGVVSYRSVPRILTLFNIAAGQVDAWVPHFTSVINWMLRLGLGLLKKVKPIAQPWLAIIGHSIDIGTKKALVILRVRADILSRKEGAIQLQDCECIGLRISETVNGNSVALESGEIFQHAGTPAAIIKDCDRTLNKGVNLWQEKQELDIPVIEDISHVMASALKKQYEDTEGYRNFTSLISKSAKNLRQTALAFLAPPKLRTKGRFLSIGRLGRWGERILDLLDVGKDRKDDDSLNKVRAALPDINDSKSFIQSFAGTAKTVSQVMELLKNKGLNNSTFSECHSLMEKLSDAQTVKKSLRDWLNQHFIIRGKVTHFSLPVSSDIIESLFGRFKHMLERNPQADMNRSALLIPVLCGTLNESVIRDALNSAPHDALKKWEQDNIPYTMRKKRREFFGETKPKTGNASAGKT